MKSQFQAQHAKEAENMVGRLCECGGNMADSQSLQLRQRPEAAFLAIGDLVHLAGAISASWLLQPALKPLGPALSRIRRFAKNVVGTFIALTEFGTHQDAASKCKLP